MGQGLGRNVYASPRAFRKLPDDYSLGVYYVKLVDGPNVHVTEKMTLKCALEKLHTLETEGKHPYLELAR